jgi:hypothetical protein
MGSRGLEGVLMAKFLPLLEKKAAPFGGEPPDRGMNEHDQDESVFDHQHRTG